MVDDWFFCLGKHNSKPQCFYNSWKRREGRPNLTFLMWETMSSRVPRRKKSMFFALGRSRRFLSSLRTRPPGSPAHSSFLSSPSPPPFSRVRAPCEPYGTRMQIAPYSARSSLLLLILSFVDDWLESSSSSTPQSTDRIRFAPWPSRLWFCFHLILHVIDPDLSQYQKFAKTKGEWRIWCSSGRCSWSCSSSSSCSYPDVQPYTCRWSDVYMQATLLLPQLIHLCFWYI